MFINFLKEDLQEILHYCKITGDFTWKVSPTSSVLRGSVAGCANSGGYISIGIKGGSYRAHRLAFLYMTGDIPEYVDHIDGNRSNNAWSNLRACTPSQNLCNSKLSKANTSGIKGVNWDIKAKKWRIMLNIGGKQRYLGLYSNLSRAVCVINEARAIHHKDFARSN